MLEVTLVVTAHLGVGSEFIAALHEAEVKAEIIFDGSTLGVTPSHQSSQSV